MNKHSLYFCFYYTQNNEFLKVKIYDLEIEDSSVMPLRAIITT